MKLRQLVKDIPSTIVKGVKDIDITGISTLAKRILDAVSTPV